MSNRIQNRRGTTAKWFAINPVLFDGELGLETDTGKFKFGDGVTPWNTLQYATTGGSSTVGTGTGDMLAAIYDPNHDGIVSHAALADSVAWANITGAPSMSALPAGATVATTPTQGDNTLKIATTAFVGNAIAGIAASGTGDMLRSTYDPNHNGYVNMASTAVSATVAVTQAQSDNSTKIATTSYVKTAIGAIIVSGGGGGDMLRSVYDTNGDGIVDMAATAGTANSVAWANVSGKISINSKSTSENITLSAADVSAVPTSLTINGKPLTGNINLIASDISGVESVTNVDGGTF